MSLGSSAWAQTRTYAGEEAQALRCANMIAMTAVALARTGQINGAQEDVLLALTNHPENLLVLGLLRDYGYRGRVAAVVRFQEEAEELEAEGCSVFNLYAQAGAGFGDHAVEQLDAPQVQPADG